MNNISDKPDRTGAVCPICDGDAEESGIAGQVNCYSCGYVGPPLEVVDKPKIIKPFPSKSNQFTLTELVQSYCELTQKWAVIAEDIIIICDSKKESSKIFDSMTGDIIRVHTVKPKGC